MYFHYIVNICCVLFVYGENSGDLFCTLNGFGFSPAPVSVCKFSTQYGVKKQFEETLDSIKTILLNSNLASYTGRNCAELLKRGDSVTGVRTVYPYGAFNDKPLRTVIVYCDQATDGGGWTVFQNRDFLPIRENFYRGWDDYVQGFGEINGEFWLGLDNLHALVASVPMELRIDLEDFEGKKRWAKYGTFEIGDAASKYTLNVGEYFDSGDAGDSLYYQGGCKFSTHDQDNDLAEWNCATEHKGGWWYNACHASNLNGYPYVGENESKAAGIIWKNFRNLSYSLKKVSMKIRPVVINSV